MATKQQFPTWDFDFTKFMADYKWPTVSFDAVMASQKKTMEAFAEANKLAVEGMQAVAKRQLEVVRQAVEEASGMGGEVFKPGAPKEQVAKQADLAKAQFDRMLANMKEMSEMLAKSNTEAANVVSKRISDSFEEFKALAAA